MRARVVCTTRADGDFNADIVARDVLEARQRAVVDVPWTWLDEVHGRGVVVVERPGDQVGVAADAAVTTVVGAAISVWVGDCAPVALLGRHGSDGRDDERGAEVIGVAHTGWRGLRDGVLAATVEAMHRLGATHVEAMIGPHIHACCYQFGIDDLAVMVSRFGPVARSTTRHGLAALDMTATLVHALEELGVQTVSTGCCTACDSDRYWSHRARGERGRQAMVAWMEES